MHRTIIFTQCTIITVLYNMKTYDCSTTEEDDFTIEPKTKYQKLGNVVLNIIPYFVPDETHDRKVVWFLRRAHSFSLLFSTFHAYLNVEKNLKFKYFYGQKISKRASKKLPSIYIVINATQASWFLLSYRFS